MFEYVCHNGKYTIKDVILMKVHDKGKFTYTEDHLKTIVNSFNERRTKSLEGVTESKYACLPKLYIGHENTEEKEARIASGKERPSIGRVDNVRLDNGMMIGDYIDIDQTVMDDLKASKYPSRSTEIMSDEDMKYMFLSGVALLGKSQPRIPLPDMILNSINNTVSVITDSDGNIIDDTNLDTYLDKMIQNKLDLKVDILHNNGIIPDNMDKKEVDMPETKTENNNEFQLQLNALTGELDKAKGLLSAYDKANEALKAEIEAIKAEGVRKDNILLLNSLEADGYAITGDVKDVYLGIMSKMNADEKNALVGTIKASFRKLSTQRNSADGVLDRPIPGAGASEGEINPLLGKPTPADVDRYFR